MGNFIILVAILLTAFGWSEAGYQAPAAKAEETLVQKQLSQYFGGYVVPATTSAKIAPHAVATAVPDIPSYWLANIKHQGRAAFNSNSTYAVFRNVKAKAYGAKGDSVSDDTAAINKAISDGNRLSPMTGGSSTNTTAVVYFPCGTYVISSPIIIYYYTQIIGNPNCMPVIQASSNFNGVFLLDGDQYQPGSPNGVLGFRPATNVFYRQIRNLQIDMTLLPAAAAITGVHWPTAQATSLQNLEILMSNASDTNHVGVLTESGSGGFMTDLVFSGGLYGISMANQQFTMRNLSFTGSNTAIYQIFDWGWTYQGISIKNCQVGINASYINYGTAKAPTTDVNVGSVVIIDSNIENTPIGVTTSYIKGSSTPPAAGAIILENVGLTNVPVAVQGPNSETYLAGTTGTTIIAGYAQGNKYTPTGPTAIQGQLHPNMRPANLVINGDFYTKSKPQYGTAPLNKFYSVRRSGAVGDGVTDDTTALQDAINKAARTKKHLFIDAGTYKVTATINIPPNLDIVGEGYSVIMSSGSFFANMKSPQPVLLVGQPGDTGQVQMSDLIVSTQASSTSGQAGAVLIRWNLKSATPGVSGLWDVHTRIGGFVGSHLGLGDCIKTPDEKVVKPDARCIAAYLALHITSSASGLYMENNWIWTADHDLDSTASDPQITVYSARGILMQGAQGPFWLYGTASEHHALYQYNFANSQDVVMGQIQTETPYYQPKPNATMPFKTSSALSDPVFPTTKYGPNKAIPNADAYGLCITDSQGMLVYGAGLYSFFNNYSTTCSNQGNGEVCQSRIISFNNSEISLYDLHTVGTNQMITLNGVDIAAASDNSAGFTTEIAVFRTSS